ncbi:MAG TPA: hypothetical protein VKY74_12685 [Chloroflexia bacterium]|nr:hypothetical protein [Chloroflexia bacterium]
MLPRPRDPWPWHAAALLGYLLLGVLATWPLAAHALVAVPGFDSPITRGGMADQDQGLWAQWWVGAALLHGHTTPLSSDLLYWPYYRSGLSLLLYDMQLLRAVIALPVQALLGLAAAYNLGIFASFALAGYGTFLLARDRGLSRPAAALAGLLFVAGPYHLMQLLWETSLVVVEALPFAVLWSWRALRTGGRAPIVLAALCIIWANLSSWYYGLYGLVALATLAAGLAWRQRHGGPGAWQPVLGRGLAIAGLYGLGYSPILVPVLGQVLAARGESGVFVNIASIRGASMQWYLLFLNTRDSVTQPAIWHGTGFLGYTATGLALWGSLRRWRQALPLVVLFAVFLNLAMGPDLHGFGTVIRLPNGEPAPLPYAFLLGLPGMTLLRAPAHASVMLLLCVALLAGLGLDQLAAPLAARLPRWRRQLPLALATGAAVLALGEYLTLPLPLYTLHWAPVFRTIGQDPASYGILELPITLHASNDHHRMFNQIAHGKGIAGGYLPRPIPDPYRQPDSPLARFTQPFTATDVLAQDEDAATRALLQLYDFRYLALYHAQKDYRVGDSPWSWPLAGPAIDDPEVTVYRVPPVALDRTYLYLGNSWGLPARTATGVQRPLGPGPGYLLAWSPGATGTLTLTLDAISPGPHPVVLALETRPLLTTTLLGGAPAQQITTPPLALARGWYRFVIADPSRAPLSPGAIVLSRAAWTPAAR